MLRTRPRDDRQALSALQSPARIPASSYEVRRHAVHARLKQIDIKPTVLKAFFEDVQHIDVQNLEYVPFMRFMLADRLDALIGQGFRRIVCGLLVDRRHGGLTISAHDTTTSTDDYVKLATALGHLIGPANHDAMSGSYFARFVVKHTDNSDSYLRQAYHPVTLHTDGTFVDEATDWLLMMKMAEEHTEGGESRILHLDDWHELARFRGHPLGSHAFTYKAPPSKNVDRTTRRPTFHAIGGGAGISYVDQFVRPETLEEARYLFDLSQSLENSPAVKAPTLPVGTLIMLNDHFWLHGRAPFRRNELLHRELIRMRGAFAPV